MERRRERRKVEGMGGGRHKYAECRVRNRKLHFAMKSKITPCTNKHTLLTVVTHCQHSDTQYTLLTVVTHCLHSDTQYTLLMLAALFKASTRWKIYIYTSGHCRGSGQQRDEW